MIRTVNESGVTAISLARPEKKNALTPAMQGDLIAAVNTAATDPTCRAILLRGEGDAFCSGFDLSLCRDDDNVLRELLSGLSRAIVALRAAPQPVVIAAHGAAIAGGCALLGGGDYVVTDAAAKIGYPVVRLGISPAVSAPFLLPHVGPAAARARMLDPTLIDGREANRIGLAHECAATAGEAASRAEQIAAELAAKPTVGLRATKQWLNELDGSDQAGAAERALSVSLGLVGSAEQAERLAQLWTR
ncbi:MAG: enoyl-CoA hydratase/isomerase family protein [Phycisphaeraceae bacterium]|nr:enoyl-CoA hydratase/isomerase family protein [Phycisphaeraceae bacterium]MBX3406806.1 enoyl-CoA hydratase/isomerase family protein [Phycisphaeraceae bacterium]